MLLFEEIRSERQRKLAAMVFCYSLANSLIAVFLPAYYLKLGSGGLSWAVEFLATQFLVLGFIPRFNLRWFPHQFEKLLFAGFGLYILYDVLLIYLDNPIIIGIVAGLALGTFWPSFNTLQLRLTDRRNRTATINTISILVMTIAASIGPVVGGLVISMGGGFVHALLISAGFYLAAILAIRRFPFERVVKDDSYDDDDDNLGEIKVGQEGGVAPKQSTLSYLSSAIRNYKVNLFLVSYVIQGLTEITWFVYPIYVLSVTGSYLGLGLVASLASIIVAIFSVTLGRISDSRKSRFTFIALGIALNCAWYALLPSVRNENELILASMITGVAGAFTSNIFSLLGDQFPKKLYAPLLVKMETCLMIGRISNLLVVVYFMSDRNFGGYFDFSAIALSLCIPLFYFVERKPAGPSQVALRA